MFPMTEYYLSQADIARELGVSNEAVRAWRKRYPNGKPNAFPEPDVWTGVELVPVKDAKGNVLMQPRTPGDPRVNPRENSRSVPGWHPGKLEAIREWKKGMVGAGARTDLAG